MADKRKDIRQEDVTFFISSAVILRPDSYPRASNF